MHVYPPKNNNAPRQQRELREFQKGRIVEARGLRMSYSEIGEELCIPRSTVSSFLTRSKQRDSVTNLPRPGRPPAISESQERYIIQTVNTNTRIPFTELRDITNTNVSTTVSAT
jgi:transposase